MIAVEIVCVVLKGTPTRVASSIVLAAAISAANPWCVCSRLIFIPMVFIMRHPPVRVPKAMTEPHKRMTHQGITKWLNVPLSTKANVKVPINF